MGNEKYFCKILNYLIKRGRSHQTQRVNSSGLLFLFNEMIKARIYMFRCVKAPSSGLNYLSKFIFHYFAGQKIACFAPENFTDGQAGALNEYCWNSGFWIGPGVPHVKSLFTQPHRYYAFYLAVQAVFCMSPIILWNVATKSRLLAVLRGTEEFLEDLVKLIMDGRDDMDPADLAEKVKGQLRQFHQIGYGAARASNLSAVLIARQCWELVLFCSLLLLQFLIYDFQSDKSFSCQVTELSPESIMCTVPVLDLLDFIWSLNVGALTIAIFIMAILIHGEIRSHFGKYQPMFINDLPYGDQDDFNEKVQWESNFTKHSYELLTLIYEENSTIMTQVYVLQALKPSVPEVDSSDSEYESETDEPEEDDIPKHHVLSKKQNGSETTIGVPQNDKNPIGKPKLDEKGKSEVQKVPLTSIKGLSENNKINSLQVASSSKDSNGGDNKDQETGKIPDMGKESVRTLNDDTAENVRPHEYESPGLRQRLSPTQGELN